MLPLRLVLDTNVVVSAALKPHGLERAAVAFAVAKPAKLFVSADILAEYHDVLTRRELKLRPSDVTSLLQFIENHADVVAPSTVVTACADLEDNMFLECAEQARADYLVTGNKRHFPLCWKSAKIINARELLEVAAPHLLT